MNTRPRYELINDDEEVKKPRYELINENTKGYINPSTGLAGFLLQAIPSVMKGLRNPSEAMSERTQALGRGLTDIGEGAKQVYLEGFGKSGEANKYTKEREAERKFYAQTPAGQDYLSDLIRKNAASIPEYAAGTVPFMGEANLLRRMLLGGQSMGVAKGTSFTPQDESRLSNIITGVGEGVALPLAFEAPSLAAKGIKTITSPLRNLKPLEEAAQNAAQGHTAALEAEEALKKSAKQELGQSDYSLMEHNLDKNKQKLSQIDQSLEQDLPKPESYLLDTPQESEKRLLNSQLAHQQAISHAQNIENQIGEHLESGASHDVEAAKIMKQHLNANKANIQDEYKALDNNLESKNIVIDNSAKLKQLNSDLFKMAQEGKIESKEALKLHDQITNMGKRDIIPAKDYVSAYKSVNGYMRDAYKKAYEPGINEAQRKQWLDRAKDAEQKLEEMDNILQEGIGEENYNQFKNISHRWKNEIVPLYKNKLYHQIMQHGRLPDNMIKELRGEGSGMDILKNIVKSDPQALKHVVGQRYDVNPKLIHNPNDLMREYTDLMPELNSLTSAKQEANLLSQKAGERASLHKTFKEEAENLNKSYQQKLGKRKDLESQRVNLQKTVKLMDKHIPELRKASENTKLKLKEKILAKNRLKRAEMKRAKARDKLKYLIYLGGGYTGYNMLKNAVKSLPEISLSKEP